MINRANKNVVKKNESKIVSSKVDKLSKPEKKISDKEIFLQKLRGDSLDYKRYLGAPIRYAGGKSLAVGYVIERIPDDTKKVVSPFIGGGSVEVAISKELGIPVQGYDIFEILVVFWNQLINNKKELIKNLEKQKPTKENYENIKKDLKAHWKGERKLPDAELAWKYYFNFNLSYGPGFLGWMSSNYLDETKYKNLIKKLEKREFPNIKVDRMSFVDSIPLHKKDFLYLDPPYFLGGDSKMFKGIYPMRNIPVHHNGFDHVLLAKLLKKHKGGFIMSYNDCPEIRELYKGFEIVNVKWQYTMGQGETRIGKNRIDSGITHVKESSEILIIGKKN